MFRTIIRYLKAYDWVLLASAGLLIAFGLATIYSIGASRESPEFGNFSKQLLFVGVGAVAAFIVSMFDFRTVFSRPWVYYTLGAALLVLVRIFGQEIRGTTGWFIVGPFTIQPVEFAKLLLIVSLAQFFARHSEDINEWRPFLSASGLILFYLLFILLQPDFGSAIVVLAIALGFFVLTRLSFRRVALLGVAVLIIAAGAWVFVLQDYQKDRVLTFLQPDRDPLGRGYQVAQSIIAVGSGQLFGRGLGLGPQSQLNFLPAQETDFIFAVIAEELGFVGSAVFLLAFGTLFIRVARVVRRTGSAFDFYLTSGIWLYLVIQTSVNIGMNIGLLPVTGIPLPFVSYGGSSFIASLLALGILESVSLRQRLRPTA